MEGCTMPLKIADLNSWYLCMLPYMERVVQIKLRILQ